MVRFPCPSSGLDSFKQPGPSGPSSQDARGRCSLGAFPWRPLVVDRAYSHIPALFMDKVEPPPRPGRNAARPTARPACIGCLAAFPGRGRLQGCDLGPWEEASGLGAFTSHWDGGRVLRIRLRRQLASPNRTGFPPDRLIDGARRGPPRRLRRFPRLQGDRGYPGRPIAS